MAGVSGDIFIVGTIQRMDLETRLFQEENGPQVNLSQFIRNSKLLHYALYFIPHKFSTIIQLTHRFQ